MRRHTVTNNAGNWKGAFGIMDEYEFGFEHDPQDEQDLPEHDEKTFYLALKYALERLKEYNPSPFA